jgi:hypothetical protein
MDLIKKTILLTASVKLTVFHPLIRLACYLCPIIPLVLSCASFGSVGFVKLCKHVETI